MRVCLRVVKVEIFDEAILCCTLVCNKAFEMGEVDNYFLLTVSTRPPDKI